MPSQTFMNLNKQKQERIKDALLVEFSHHSLADAQVARIVTTAQIARGAFYKYFSDLTDAYYYLYDSVLELIHPAQIRQHKLLTAVEYTKRVKEFIERVCDSRYYGLVKLHYQYNAPLLSGHQSSLMPVSTQEWGVMVLIHETIKECLLEPQNSGHALQRLQTLLKVILEEENK